MVATGIKPHFLDKLSGNGVQLPPNFFQIEEPSETHAAGGYGAFGRRA